MKNKLIGVTARVDIYDGIKKQFVNDGYITELTKRGLNTIMLTLDNECIEDILSLCDGFLITGGYDINPSHYHEKNESSRNCNDSLDSLDKNVIMHAVKHSKPVLGICRGHQALNIFLGGSLYQDIKNHTSISSDHIVTTFPNRLLALDNKIKVNSYHHQAVKALAPGLKEIAKHIDETNEGFIHETLPFIGVQWHPEKMGDSKESKTIFDTFTSLVNK